MTPVSESPIVTNLIRFSRVVGPFIVTIAAVVLVGWIMDIPFLKSLGPELVAMKPNAAISFGLAGISLWFLSTRKGSRRKYQVAKVCAVVTALIGLLTLAEYIAGSDFGIDQLLFRESAGAVGTSNPRRMSPIGAVNFLLVGLALWLFHSQRQRLFAQLLVLAALLISLVAFIGYAYEVEPFYGIATYTQMALHSAVSYLILCFGILCAMPGEGMMTVATADSAGGIMIRRVLPAAIVVPPLLDWLRLQGQDAKLYTTEFGSGLYALAIVVFFVILIWPSGRTLHSIDLRRRKAEERLERSSAELARSNKDL